MLLNFTDINEAKAYLMDKMSTAMKGAEDAHKDLSYYCDDYLRDTLIEKENSWVVRLSFGFIKPEIADFEDEDSKIMSCMVSAHQTGSVYKQGLSSLYEIVNDNIAIAEHYKRELNLLDERASSWVVTAA